MKLYLYNNDFTEQSVRQMQTIISSLSNCVIVVDNKWENKIINTSLLVEYNGFDKFIECKEKKAVLYFNIFDGYQLKKLVKKHKLFLIFRPRGLLPEESFYKHNKLVRKIVLNYIESIALRITDYFLFIDDNQRIHYLSKYQNITSKFDNYSILPNLISVSENTVTCDQDNNVRLVYSGGFSKWQNIDLVFQVVSRIIKKNKLMNSKKKIIFAIFTFENNFETAKNYAEKYKIRNDIELNYVSPKDLNKNLSNQNVGIIIRDNNIVNSAASPFKIMDYLTNGLGLILTNNISNQVKGILDDQYFFELGFKNGALEYDDKKLLEFIMNISNKDSKQIIFNSYRQFVSKVKKINISEIIK